MESESAGAESPHLKQSERDQAADHSAPAALVIHEVVREDGERELAQKPGAVAWSGLAAGLSMGFSFLCLALVTSFLPATPASHLIASWGYTVGFVITVLGRQELYTESTLTALLPLLVRRDRATLIGLLRFWVVVLISNLAGTIVFAWLVEHEALFKGAQRDAMQEVAAAVFADPFGVTLIKAMLSGWLIATMAWLLPSARSARLLVILLLTYVVALCGLPHVVAGSVEAAFAVWSGHADVHDYLLRFLLPTLIGNTIGGVALVGLLNHAPLVEELKSGGAEEPAATPRRSGRGSASRRAAR